MNKVSEERMKLRIEYSRETDLIFSDNIPAYADWLENKLALRQPPVSGRSEQFICPCCGSDKTYKTDAIHCNRCAVTTEIYGK